MGLKKLDEMKFEIEYGESIYNFVLTYITEECAFNMEPWVSGVDFDLVLNKLSLSVVNNTIIQICGFCGLSKSMKSTYEVPKYKKGSLKVITDLEPGFAYRINDEEDWPVYVNYKAGWVCVGDPNKPGQAVEFINNCCVAVVNDKGDLASLWLKPVQLPNCDKL